MIHTSGFVDDVMASHNVPNADTGLQLCSTLFTMIHKVVQLDRAPRQKTAIAHSLVMAAL